MSPHVYVINKMSNRWPQDIVMNDKAFAYETHVAYVVIFYVILISVTTA